MSEQQGPRRQHYLNATYGLKSWLLTKDHKRIAILYLLAISVFFLLGGLFAVLIRLELATPAGDLVQPDTYNRLFTMHGVMMIFFFLIPSIPAVLGNFLIPLMIGAKDLAFPKLNLASWYIYMLGGSFTLWAMVNGGVDTGWTFYTPFSTTYSNSYVIADGAGHLHPRLLVDPDRAQLHRHHPPHAGAGADLVPAAAVRLVALRHQPDPDPGHPGAGRSPSCWWRPSGCSTSASSIPPWAATRCSSSTCSGSTPTRRSTS